MLLSDRDVNKMQIIYNTKFYILFILTKIFTFMLLFILVKYLIRFSSNS